MIICSLIFVRHAYLQRLCFCSGAISKPRPVTRNPTWNEDKTLNQLVTAPLQKHFVGSCRALLHIPFVALSFVTRLSYTNLYCQSCDGAFFTYYFVHLHKTKHTYWLALVVGCKCGQTMCVRIAYSLKNNFSFCNLLDFLSSHSQILQTVHPFSVKV